jgi:DNA repair protein RadC
VIVSQGTLNASVVHPREVFRIAITESAASVILLHNHPSGNIEPSKEDLEITKKLVDAGNMIDIKVLDHIIIGGDNFTSFAKRGLI